MKRLDLNKTGFGLGLTLTRKALEILKGNLDIKSGENQGTLIRFVLKFKFAEPENASDQILALP